MKLFGEGDRLESTSFDPRSYAVKMFKFVQRGGKWGNLSRASRKINKKMSVLRAV